MEKVKSRKEVIVSNVETKGKNREGIIRMQTYSSTKIRNCTKQGHKLAMTIRYKIMMHIQIYVVVMTMLTRGFIVRHLIFEVS